MQSQRPTGSAGTVHRDGPGMNAWERQQVFREMVIHQLGNGRLSSHRRKQIVQYAACLGINARLAGRLVQEAQRTFERRSADERQILRCVSSADRKHSKRWRGICAVVVGLTILNAWLILRFFG